jgi:hypothetical protein
MLLGNWGSYKRFNYIDFIDCYSTDGDLAAAGGLKQSSLPWVQSLMPTVILFWSFGEIETPSYMETSEHKLSQQKTNNS